MSRVRWIICGLLLAAVALSYVDRLVLSVLKPSLQEAYGWSETGYGDVVFWFQAAYGIGYLVFGRLVERIGPKLGYALAVGLWTAGHMAHAFVTSTMGFALVRIPLALGESGAFPSALAAVSDWFPRRERALAIGIFNAGSNLGAILTPLIVPAIALAWGWRAAFLVTGGLTLVWLAVWLIYYRRPREHPAVDAAELAYIESEPAERQRPVPWRRLLAQRQTWAYMLGRFLIDPIWWTFLFWLPDFFGKRYGIDMKGYGPPLVAIYVLADIGSVLGGWVSSRRLARGASVNSARKSRHAVLRARRHPGRLRHACADAVGGGRPHRPGLRRPPGILRQPLRPAVRPLPALGVELGGRPGRRGGRAGRDADGQIFGVGSAGAGQLHADLRRCGSRLSARTRGDPPSRAKVCAGGRKPVGAVRITPETDP